jgi:hypothetical protein
MRLILLALAWLAVFVALLGGILYWLYTKKRLEVGTKFSLSDIANFVSVLLAIFALAFTLATQYQPEPRIESDIGAAGHESHVSVNGGTLNVEVDASRHAFDFSIAFRNVGHAALRKPLVMFDADPATVRFEPRQFNAPSLSDFLPFAQIRHAYRVETRGIIPQHVDAFDILIHVSGDNMDAQETRTRVTVTRKTRPGPR